MAKHFTLNSEELWLWYRYALMPAILDVTDLIKAFKGGDPINQVQSGKQSMKTVTGESDFVFHKGSSNEFHATNQWESEIVCRCGSKMQIVRRVDPAEWGTGLHDVLMGAWERIPFSFLADWFINVGDWLASIRPIDLEYAQTYATFAVDVKTKVGSGSFQAAGDELQIHAFLQDRVVGIEPPRLPLIDTQWANCTRYVDLISLTVGMLKSILKRR
jgi:hypothetical protein